jgi:hypothetical protein
MRGKFPPPCWRGFALPPKLLGLATSSFESNSLSTARMGVGCAIRLHQ